ncbi:hypothetical protein [Paracoccus aminophilus]|uniref:Lipoprotein n=1 Tax=Paracoccus aminophilus JCM 7686 TaxID=1367847 RepID=S5XSI0_PARAH|nr:hypothetical protein [Paracoccus aminophilus]AGT10409.1 hypothetical protein JCM7686_3374 [Paracoccus aminophilus JCM 7686]
MSAGRRFLPMMALAALAACSSEAIPVVVPQTAVAPPPENMPFLGSWDCGVTVMHFAPDKYTPSKGAKALRVHSYTVKGTTTDIALEGGDRIAVQVTAPGQMTWTSNQSGDSFQCRRVAS